MFQITSCYNFLDFDSTRASVCAQSEGRSLLELPGKFRSFSHTSLHLERGDGLAERGPGVQTALGPFRGHRRSVSRLSEKCKSENPPSHPNSQDGKIFGVRATKASRIATSGRFQESRARSVRETKAFGVFDSGNDGIDSNVRARPPEVLARLL